MPCPYCESESGKNGSARCELSGGQIDSETFQKYCSASGNTYEGCDQFVKAEVLTPAVCEEIIRSFSELVSDTCEGLAALAELVEDAFRYDYIPLVDAFRTFEVPPQIPSASGTYAGIVKTQQEKELAVQLDSNLDNLLSSLRFSIRCGHCEGAYPHVSSSDVSAFSRQVDRYGGHAAEYMEGYSLSVKPDKYAEPAERLAREAGSALRHRMQEAAASIDQAAQQLESGIKDTLSSISSDGGWVLRDAYISWEVD